MLEHLHSIICARVIVDQKTGLASYIDIIEGITLVNPKKFTLPPFSIISRFWIREDIGDGQVIQVKISKKRPDEKKAIELQRIEVPITQKGENYMLDLKVENLDMGAPGLWVFDIKFKLLGEGNWKKGAIIPFKIAVDENRGGNEKQKTA